MGEIDPWEEMSEVAREMSVSVDLQETLEAAVRGAVQLIEPVEAACVAQVFRGGRVETPAATDERSRRANELQYELGEGPCLDAIADEELVVVRDLTTERRWPTWAPRAADELGIRSMLGLQLFVADDSLGALTLFSDQVDAFDDLADRVTAGALAAHIAIALFSARESDQLQSAMVNRTVIGQAQGMLMQKYDLEATQAFAVLTRASQHSNRKLHEIAAEIVRLGVRPEILE